VTAPDPEPVIRGRDAKRLVPPKAAMRISGLSVSLATKGCAGLPNYEPEVERLPQRP